jgi:hypothetical protein
MRPSTLSIRQRDNLARLMAMGQPVAAAARGADLPPEAIDALMDQALFRDLIEAWKAVLADAPDARTQRLAALAEIVIAEAVADGDPVAIMHAEEEEEEDQPEHDAAATRH